MDKDELYEEFKRKFPLEHLKHMTIDEYVLGAPGEDSFCAWLEFKTKELGNISGGSSFIHGIYKFKKSPELRFGQMKDDKYAWYSKYGNTRDDAFKNIRSKIVEIAEAAKKEEYGMLDGIDFSPSTKMKIAFMYSDKKMINIFSESVLLWLSENDGIDQSLTLGEKSHRLMDGQGYENYWNYTGAKWRQWIEMKNKESQITHFFIGSVGRPGEGYDDENLDRCIESLAHVMHRNTKQKGVFSKVKPNSILFLKYKDNLVAYGLVKETTRTEDPDEDGWSYRIKVDKWFFYDNTDCRKGVSNYGVSSHIIDGSQMATLKEISEEYAMEKMAEIDPTTSLYINLKMKIVMNQYKKLLNKKKNIILQGAPGVGKTYATSSMAVAICNDSFANFGSHDDVKKEYDKLVEENRIEFCTFHQSMDYEDFVEGLKPVVVTNDKNEPIGIKYEVVPGIFKRICENARNHLDDNYVLIIDEINRGNVSRIFGELITLLEPDKRMGECNELRVMLPYTKWDCGFTVPSNLYIIGTMNTTDRSIGTIDYALRRRFAFVTLHANQDLIEHGKARELFNKINAFIKQHFVETVDVEDLEIGHSYFMGNDKESLKLNLEYSVIPLVKEYIRDGIIICTKEEAEKEFTLWKNTYGN